MSASTRHPCAARNKPDAACRMLSHALLYARNGMPVFPCKRENKHPHTKNGYRAATTDLDKIRRWWKKHPTAMIAAPTGSITNMVVIDCDVKTCDGIAAFHALRPKGAASLATLTVKTPSGGAHYYYRHPGAKVACTASRLAHGVDTRGDGGYIIMPPSCSEKGSYTAEEGIDTPQSCPDWLLAVLATKGIHRTNQRVTDEADESDETDEIEAIVCASAPPTRVPWLPYSITCPVAVVAATYPRQPGTRNGVALNLARGLKFDCGRAKQPIAELKPFVRVWHHLAGTNTSSYFTESWADFLVAFERAEKPLSSGNISSAWELAANSAPHPAAVANEYDSANITALVGACHHLSKHDRDGVFFISTRSIQKLAGVNDAMTCYRWLRLLEIDGIISVVAKGNQGHATRYRWTWREDQQVCA